MRNIPFFLFFCAPYWVVAQALTSDCSGAIQLCSKNLVTISSLNSAGTNVNEVGSSVCYPEKPFSETNAVWLRWQIDIPGSLTFTIIPNDEHDDLDFILYKELNTNFLCRNMEMIRCMRAGPVLGDTSQENQSCTGATGLNNLSSAERQPTGCNEVIYNFLSPIETQSGEIYTLLVNNYRSTSGFAIGFEGTAAFKPDFGNCSPLTNTTSEISDDQIFRITNVFPNPANNKVNLEINSNADRNANIQVISADGILHSSQSLTIRNGTFSHSIPIDMLNPGVYFLKIHTENYVEITRFFKR